MKIVSVHSCRSLWIDIPPVSVSFESDHWQWILSANQEIKQNSRYLTRLHLLKELFSVFVNRIVRSLVDRLRANVSEELL